MGEERPAQARALFMKSEGNPFFMTELARQIKDREPGATLEPLNLPHAALDLVRQRVEKLDAAARGALSLAAVIGRHFSLQLLQTITGSDTHTLMQNLDQALASGLVSVARDSATSFAFSHELLRATLYEGLSPAERRESHYHTAQALEQRVAAGEVWPAAELAYHFRSALPDGDAQGCSILHSKSRHRNRTRNRNRIPSAANGTAVPARSRLRAAVPTLRTSFGYGYGYVGQRRFAGGCCAC